MPPKGKILSSRASYPDRAQLQNNDFAPLDVVITDPMSAVLLLSSKDFKLLVKSLHQLDKFGQADKKNMEQLYTGKVIESFLKNNLLNHNELFVKRFSLKIASEMFFYEDFKFDNQILQEVFDTAKSYYKKSDDLFITEYCAVIILNLMREARFVVDLEQDNEFIAKLFKYISDTSDPDILYNSYKISIRLFQSLLSTGFICEVIKFPFERVIGDLSNEFPDIQKAALEILAQIVQCKGEAYSSKLCCPVFFEELLKVLENDEVAYLHALTIDVLKEIMEFEIVANEFANSDYVLRLIQHMKKDLNCRYIGCSVLSGLAKYPDLLEFLNVSKVPDILLDLLLFDPSFVTKDILIALKRFLYHPESLSKIIKRNPINGLMKILKLDNLQLKIRNTTAELLGVLSARNKSMCQEITIDISNVVAVIFSKPYATYPTDFLLNLMTILNNLAKYQALKTTIVNDKFAQSLVLAITNSYRSSVLFSGFLNTASNYISVDRLKTEFLKNNVAEIILKGLKNSAVIVKNAATNFILLTGKFEDFSTEYIDNGVLKYLLCDDKSISTCSSWSAAIDAVLTPNPSLKFYIRGKLDMNDISGKDFVVSKKQYRCFTVFRTIMKDDVSPLHSLIITNFDHAVCESFTTIEFQTEAIGEQGETVLPEKWRYCRRPADDNLPRILSKLKRLLEVRGLSRMHEDNPNLIDITKIADRAKVIAEIVANELCGSTPGQQSDVCSEEFVLNHLNHLKYQLHCNVIPLGMIKYGGPLERAILFKGLADQIGLPCSLVRSVDGRVLFNEIPLPTVDNKVHCSMNVLPTKLLSLTHIVDLMETPGELYPIESRKAFQYLQLL